MMSIQEVVEIIVEHPPILFPLFILLIQWGSRSLYRKKGPDISVFIMILIGVLVQMFLAVGLLIWVLAYSEIC